jgi:hypothetical protein
MMASLLLFAPASSGRGVHISTATLVIIAIVIVLGGVAMLGWRAPDRSPKIDEKIDREEQE